MAVKSVTVITASAHFPYAVHYLTAVYGRSPLEPGRDAIVTVQMKQADPGPAPELRAPSGIAVESPAIRIDGGRQISWRIRALHPLAGALQFVFPDQTVEKSVESGTGPRGCSQVSARWRIRCDFARML